ncbi:MAG: hypothetical protein J6B06_00660 [Lachnospiraceae bacterium]|nr:hypothetical protein [Lachnospiraceae bacterium]
MEKENEMQQTNEVPQSTDDISHIFDKTFKKILTLSSTAVINLVNGLFDTNYPTESTITYNWTEFVDKNLKHILADTIITINGVCSYHMEAQMTTDADIVLRVFEYGYSHANRNAQKERNSHKIIFPEPKIIYLYSDSPAPDDYLLELDFGTQGSFYYHVPTFKFLETSTEELNRKKLVILIPFSLLKLRKSMQKECSKENLEALKNLIQNDIIGSINENLLVGNITEYDARILKRLTHKLYLHIYSHYKELEEVTEMTDESFLLDIEIMEKEHQKELAEMQAEKDAALAEKDAVLAEKDAALAEISLLKKKLEEAGIAL